ncbi:MAG TPA: hypothetical protein VMF89_23630, partial [Polyangiales bacterium]|nr:hypothetical protein [Polyangiales bacterium]
MERDSQELRPYSQSWPPGFLTGSMVFDAGARTRRRDGLTMVCLAICAYCLAFGVTDWACESSEKTAATMRAEAEAVALQRRRAAELTGARALSPEPEAITPEPVRVAEAAPRAKVVASANTSPLVQKRTKRAPAESRSEPAAPAKPAVVDVVDEPTPMVSVDELNQALALADASTRIFASVDEHNT